MKSFIQVAVLSAMTGLCALPAAAQVGVTLNFGDVAIAYRDGYWDSHHQWHHWTHSDDWRNYSRQHPEHYHDYTHDRDEHPH